MNSRRRNLLVGLALLLCVSIGIARASTVGLGQISTVAAGDSVDTTGGGGAAGAGSASNGGAAGSGTTASATAASAATADSSSTMPLPRGPNGELPEVLDPNKYVGQVKAGYAAAKEVPQIVDKLFCYCGCDLTDCHGTLLDCFTNEHGEDCHICQEEAIIALKLHQKGKTVSDIQKEIDKKFQKEYPFEVESPALQKYKANRLWDMGKKKPSTATLGTVQPGATGENAQPKRKLKPDGSCCAGND